METSEESGTPLHGTAAAVTPRAEMPSWLRALYPFSSHTFATEGGHRLSYLDEGPRSAEAVLCVHGNPTWSFFYRGVVRRLAGLEGGAPPRRVIAVDHLGCGLSDKPQEPSLYTLDRHAGRLRALLQALGAKRLHLVLHDWGGAIGLGALLPRLEDVASVTLLNTAAFPSLRIPLRIALCKLPGFGALLVRGANGFAWPATWMTVTRPLPREVKRAYLFPYSSWRDRVAVHRFVRDIPLSPRHPSFAALAGLEPALDRLRQVPVQILWGKEDFCFNDHFLAEWRRRLPEAEVRVFADAGHYVLEDAAGECLERIDAFTRPR